MEFLYLIFPLMQF